MSNTSKPKHSQWLEFGPILAFVISYAYLRRSMENPEQAIYVAAAILAALSVVALLYIWAKHKAVSGLLILTTVIVCLSAGLAYFFDDDRFIKMKPTVVNILFGLGVLGGVLFKKNVLKMMLGEAFELADKAWNTLAIRWGLFFFVLAAINEVVWRTQTEQFWVNFKFFGLVPLTFIFTMSQIPFIMKHGKVKGQE